MMTESGRYFNFHKDYPHGDTWFISRVGVGRVGTIFLTGKSGVYGFTSNGMSFFTPPMLREIADFCERKTKEHNQEVRP